MSEILDILVKSQELNKISIEECFVEWGEEKLSQDPPQFKHNSNLVFRQNLDLDYYENIVKKIGLSIQNFTALTLEGDKLEELNKMVNSGKNITYTIDLISFINEMYNNLSAFCLIKLRDEECIDEFYNVSDAPKAIDIFINSFMRNDPKGIVIIKNL